MTIDNPSGSKIIPLFLKYPYERPDIVIPSTKPSMSTANSMGESRYAWALPVDLQRYEENVLTEWLLDRNCYTG